MDIRFGVIGCGFFGRNLARTAAALPGMRVAGVIDAVPEAARELSAELGCVAFRGMDELLGADVDAVLVATPNHAHRDPVIAAAAARKHVFVEKPMAVTGDDCAAMLRAAETSGVRLVVGHVLRTLPGVRRMREEVRSGSIGTPSTARAARTRWVDTDNAPEGWWKLDRRATGGELVHEIHDLDLLCWMLGDIDTVFAQAGNRAHPRTPGYDDVIQVALRASGGALGTLEIGGGYHLPQWSLTVGGTDGAIRLDLREASVTVVRRGEVQHHWTVFEDAEANASLRAAAGEAVQRYNLASGTVPLWLSQAIGAELRGAAEAFTSGAVNELSEAPDRAVHVADAAEAAIRTGLPVEVGHEHEENSA